MLTFSKKNLHDNVDDISVINKGVFDYQLSDPFHGIGKIFHPTTFGKRKNRFDQIVFDKRLGSLQIFYRLNEERWFDAGPETPAKTKKKDVLPVDEKSADVPHKKRVSDHMLIAAKIELELR